MPACYMPEVFRRAWDLLRQGDADGAHAYFAPFSRLAAYEKDVCNRCVWKELLVRRGVIACGATRAPRPAFADDWQLGQLVGVAARAGLRAVSLAAGLPGARKGDRRGPAAPRAESAAPGAPRDRLLDAPAGRCGPAASAA